eukprot:scaffold1954_cov268-Pinguiococcus_pyrenoidosus.AAC.206
MDSSSGRSESRRTFRFSVSPRSQLVASLRLRFCDRRDSEGGSKGSSGFYAMQQKSARAPSHLMKNIFRRCHAHEESHANSFFPPLVGFALEEHEGKDSYRQASSVQKRRCPRHTFMIGAPRRHPISLRSGQLAVSSAEDASCIFFSSCCASFSSSIAWTPSVPSDSLSFSSVPLFAPFTVLFSATFSAFASWGALALEVDSARCNCFASSRLGSS